MIKSILIKWKLNKAAIRFKNNDLESAQKIYEEILDSHPNNFNALLWLGSIHSEKMQFPKAFELLNKAISINPHRYEPYYNLGLMKAELNRHDEAIQTWQKAIKITNIPKIKKAELFYNISRTLIDLKDYGVSIDYANKALALKPNYIEAEENKMYAFHMINRQ